MRIGIVCPYSWDIPGGVQAHVRDLAEELISRGHQVSVLAPGDDDTPGLPPYVTAAGRAAVRIPYNGSVARLQFGLVAASRVRRWLRDGAFDVVHVHEPAPPSLSLLACIIHEGPLVATFHMAVTRSRWLSAFDSVLQPFLEKITGKIAVSPAARKVIVEHLGGDAVVIPNGVAVAHYTDAEPLPGYPRHSPGGGTIGFIGRYDESRKGMDVLVGALEVLAPERPDLKVLVAGRGDSADFLQGLPDGLADRFELMGQVSEEDKARMLRSVDVYCAPNTGGESFGVILLEAMASETAVVASDLEAFRRVLGAGVAGRLFPTGDSAALAAALVEVLDDADLRARLVAAGTEVVAPFDWSVIVSDVLRVYELAIAGAGVPI
ncbi:MAG TPA: glycosyltransferase family 4 protein [Jatrophihabitans sp.]|uniref:glycosyltransferase family 4 protein n=1 Tax=Jatrophihabitans sp. TaxID=1932789 RepID=UPI002E0B9F74|nr:glycosyltransferase family 4 protein [Jatrophihabitans sp.]